KEKRTWQSPASERRSRSPARSASGATTSRRSRNGTHPTVSSSRSTAAGAAVTLLIAKPDETFSGDSVVARQTRAERRARREARERSMARNPGTDGAAAARPALQPAPAQAGSRSDGKGAGNFIRESIGELRKVEWPS